MAKIEDTSPEAEETTPVAEPVETTGLQLMPESFHSDC
jgi:hypothetical protein